MKSGNHIFSNRQRGAVLIVSLLMLLVMTLIGVTSMSTTALEEKMAGNNRQRQLAFQSASSALRFAETWMQTNITNITQFQTQFSGTPVELYWTRAPKTGQTPRAIPMDVYDESTWTVGNSQEPNVSMISGTQRDPRYAIEYMGRIGEAPLDWTRPDDRKYAFRITSIGWGSDDITNYVAQSTLRMQLY